MSDVSGGNLHVFYRFTVPGAVIVFWVLLSLPNTLLQSNLFKENEGIFLAVIIGNLIVTGWTSYYTIYPAWRWFLTRIRLYPRSKAHDAIKELIKDSGKNVQAREIWSYFLHSQSDSVRDRVKTLADYGHSLFLVSFTFLFFPFVFLLLKSYAFEKTFFDELITLMIGESYLSRVEIIFVIISLAIGGALLASGRSRIKYAYDYQWVVYKNNEQTVKDLINSM